MVLKFSICSQCPARSMPIGDERKINDPMFDAQIKAFRGKLDGNGYVIKNMTVNISTGSAGLFSYISGCEIRNLGMIGSVNSGRWDAGGIVGINVVLYGNESTIVNCFNQGIVFSLGDEDWGYAGGIIGDAPAVEITQCYNTGNIEMLSGRAGGIVGGASANGIPIVKTSFNVGAISADSAGGIMGHTYGGFEFMNFYNAGAITGYSAGGIAGQQAGPGNGLIRASYNSGSLNGNYTGGLNGFCILPLRFDSCYYLNTVSKAIGSYETGYPVTSITYTPPTAGQLSATQMATQSSFSGFDFDNV